MNKKKFYSLFGIAFTGSGTLTSIVYSRSEAVIYFWNCTANTWVCNLTNAIIFFAISTISIFGLLYFGDFLLFARKIKTIEAIKSEKKLTFVQKYMRKSFFRPKIRAVGVEEPRKESRGYRSAKIQVTNVGKESIRCVAKLIGVTRKFGNKEETLKIEKINPNGKFLEWNSSRNSVSTLHTNIPDTVNVLASLREAYTYGDDMIFTFHGYDDVEEIKHGDYKISVAFLYSDGNQLREFYVFEGILRFDQKTLEWA